MTKVTKAMGTTFFVDDSLVVSLSGVDPEDLYVKGRSGKYRLVRDSVSGKKVGVVTALKKGTIKLYKMEGKKKKTVCVLKAEQPKLKSFFNIKVGKTKKLKVSGTKSVPDGWKSSNNSVVEVHKNGILIANAPGTANIVAEIGNHVLKGKVVVRE